MAKVLKPPMIQEQLAQVRERVAQLHRTSRPLGEVPLFATSFRGLVFEDSTSFTTVFETRFVPRAAWLDMGLVLIGDQVGAQNSGGTWQVKVNGLAAASGSVAPTFTYTTPTMSLDLSPYRSAAEVHVEVQVRRTFGATTGGLYGTGGTIGCSPRYAKLR